MRANQPELGGGGEYHEDEETTMKRYLYKKRTENSMDYSHWM